MATNSMRISFLIVDHPEWGDEVARNKDRTVKHPMEINEPLAWILGTICLAGLSVHCEIIIHILYDKAMRLQPKYVVQLAIALSGLLILSDIALVILHFCFGSNEIVCHFFVSFLLGISYNCFLLNYSLSLIECFVSITFPLWHRVYVTPRRVVYGLIGLNSTVALAMEWPIITGIVPVRCALQFDHGLYINGTSFVLFTMSLVFCCIDFVITLLHLRHQLPSSVAAAVPMISSILISSPSLVAVNHSQEEVIAETSLDLPSILEEKEMKVLMGLRRRLSAIPEELLPETEETTTEEEETISVDMTVSCSSDDGDNQDQSVQSSCTTLSPLEWKAIKMFLIGAVPLFLIPLPLFLFYFVYHLLCKQFNYSLSINQVKELEQCTDLTWLIYDMFAILVSLHSLVNPITSLWLNKDFQRPSPIRRMRMRMMPFF